MARLRTTTSALSNAGTYTEVVGVGDVWVFVRAAPDGDDRNLIALNNGEVAVDLRDVLTDTGPAAALVALLDDAEVVLAPAGWSDPDPGDPTTILPVGALLLRLPTPNAV